MLNPYFPIIPGILFVNPLRTLSKWLLTRILSIVIPHILDGMSTIMTVGMRIQKSGFIMFYQTQELTLCYQPGITTNIEATNILTKYGMTVQLLLRNTFTMLALRKRTAILLLKHC